MVRVCANQFIGTYGTGFRAFRVVAQCDTRNTHHGGLLGDAAAVGNDGFRAFHQIVKLQIAQRFNNMKVTGTDAQIIENLRCARMNRKDNR